MSETPFYRTQMGQRFYEHTVPELAKNLGRVADLLERVVVALERSAEAHAVTDTKEPR